MSSKRITRRRFVKTAIGATAAFTIVPRHVLGGAGYIAPSDVITRAVIGTGGMGMNHVAPNEDGKPPITLAVCDVDENHLARGLAKAGRGCTPYTDFRRVLERADIDTLHVATPPHWHALIEIAVAHRSCSLVNLANIAIRTARKIQWDPVEQKVIGDEQANRLVDVPMRAAWHV